MDGSTISKIIKDTTNKIISYLPENFWGNVKDTAQIQNTVGFISQEMIENFTKSYKINRSTRLSQKRDELIREIRNAIESKSELSTEAKNFVKNINPPKIPNTSVKGKCEEVYRKSIESRRFLIFWESKVVNQGKLKDLLQTEFRIAFEDMVQS
ncbi:MAG: hypothetical protein FWF59_04580 [Turicibacter sp.]|nr:hypothetical protein [Turicibacter sp.]